MPPKPQPKSKPGRQQAKAAPDQVNKLAIMSVIQPENMMEAFKELAAERERLHESSDPEFITMFHDVIDEQGAAEYLARVNDPPPGNMVMWRGLSRLTGIELGATIGMKIVGN